MIDVNNFYYMKIGLVLFEKICFWFFGEVKKFEIINYCILKFEKDGLFCERIFGFIKDWECSCGKYKCVCYKGMVCDRCGVEVIKFKVCCERMGYIEFVVLVFYIWYFKGILSCMGLLFDMLLRVLEEVIYFVFYVVVDLGLIGLEKKILLFEVEFRDYYDKYLG